MSSISDGNDRLAKHIVLITSGWIWCAVMGLVATSMLFIGSMLAAAGYGISAFLAAPSSWRLLARYGISATRPVKTAAVIGAWLVGSFAIANPSSSITAGSGEGAVASALATTSDAAPTTCEGIKSSPKDFAVRQDGPLRERADAGSAQVSIPFGVAHDVKPVSINTTMPVREVCRSGKWSYVTVLQLPSDIGNAKGWVPTANLRPVPTDESGRRIYGAGDFEWVDGSIRYQKAVLTVVNRVMAQNPKCDAFNSQSILVDRDRAGPLIKVACFGQPEQIVDFRPDDATNGRSFAPVIPTDERTALAYCQAALTERAAHPSTVELGYGRFQANDDGSATYQTSFTAKNSFNLSLKYETLCSFMGSKLVGIDIHEAAE